MKAEWKDLCLRRWHSLLTSIQRSAEWMMGLQWSFVYLMYSLRLLTSGLSNSTFLPHVKSCFFKSRGRAAERILNCWSMPVQSMTEFGTQGRCCVTWGTLPTKSAKARYSTVICKCTLLLHLPIFSSKVFLFRWP